MNPDTGDDAEDWFAKFEREAREAAQKRAAEEDAAAPPASSVPPAAGPPPLVPPPLVPPPAAAPPPAGPPPQLNNPFNPPAQPVAPPPAWEQPPTEAMPTTYGPGTTYGPPLVEPPVQLPVQPPVQPPSFDPGPTQAMPSFSEEPTQALVPAPLRPPGSPEPGSALDALFGDDAFREYDDGLGPDPSNSPFANRSKDLVYVPGDGPPPPPGFGTPQKILAGVGGGLLAVIALIALFLLGTRLPDLLGPAPAVATPTPTPTPTRAPLAAGPVAPGTYDWDELLGGECLEPYDVATGAWAEEYTVVDCATPHTAQMVYRAWFPPEPAPTPDPEDPDAEPVDPDAEPVWAEYPGPEALQAQISLLCAASGVIDYAAAREYTDAQVQGSYPMTAEQWETDPSYYCFVSRSSGAPLTKSLAVPR